MIKCDLNHVLHKNEFFIDLEEASGECYIWPMNNSNEKTNKYDMLTLLIKESDSYNGLDQIEKLIEYGKDFSNISIQPMYLAMKKLPSNQVAHYLSYFSKEQRSVFLDIDLWTKDDIDVENFSFWVQAYSECIDEAVKADFVQSEQFLLYLKSRFNVWSFDAEEPEYPDHDNYFLTDDNLLLFEFDDTFNQVDETRALIRHLYSVWGVERAYTFLFKMVSDSYLTLQEDEYQIRKNRLRDYGFVDYMEALEVENAFINMDFLNLFIKNKQPLTGNLDNIAKSQNLHNSSLIAFKDKFESVTDEVQKVSDQKRLDYLQFNFIKLINARLELQGALKKGSVAMTKSGTQTKNLISLGFNYVIGSNLLTNIPDEGVFSLFSFGDLFKIGNSLIKFNLKDLKKALNAHGFEDEVETFLGDYWGDFLDNSFEMNPKFHRTGSDSPKAIVEYEDYQMWIYKSKTLIALIPFAKKFYETFNALKEEGRLQDSFYLNYTVDEINFEALLMSSFANYYLSSFHEKNETATNAKLGLTVDEFRIFFRGMIPETSGSFVLTPELFKKLSAFSKSYGLDQVYDFNSYLQELIKTQLEGYEIDDLEDEDFKHVGGPIILTIKKH